MRELDDWRPTDAGQRLILTRRVDWEFLEYRDIATSQISGGSFLPCTAVGTGASPAFEWNHCVRGEDFIQRGRIYFKTDWLEAGSVHVKGDESTRWFDRIANWIRRNGKPSHEPRHYMMPNAARLAASNEMRLTILDSRA